MHSNINNFFLKECGLFYKTPNVRIIGGVEAVPDSWPSMAYITLDYEYSAYLVDIDEIVNGKVSLRCAGTLIDRQTVLTASHCVSNKTSFTYKGKTYSLNIEPNEMYPNIESTISVYLGVHDKSLVEFGEIEYPTIKRGVLKRKPHEMYDPYFTLNDIALLVLDKEVELNEHIQIACLPPDSFSYPGTNITEAYAVGWGLIDSSGKMPDLLRNVKLTIYKSSDCHAVAVDVEKNWNSQMCAGDLKGKKAICNGKFF